MKKSALGIALALGLSGCAASPGTMLLGTWSSTSTINGNAAEARYVFNGSSEGGTTTGSLIITNTDSRCRVTLNGTGTWTATGTNLVITITAGSGDTTGCTDPSMNRPSEAIPASDLPIVQRAFGGMHTFSVMGNTLTLTRAGGMPGTFTRVN